MPARSSSRLPRSKHEGCFRATTEPLRRGTFLAALQHDVRPELAIEVCRKGARFCDLLAFSWWTILPIGGVMCLRSFGKTAAGKLLLWRPTDLKRFRKRRS